MSAVIDRGIDASLCILVKVKDSLCALQGSYVESISLLEQKITGVPDTGDARLGLIQYRGGALGLLELRRMLGLTSQAADQQAFEQMLEQRRQDHVHWVDELKRCLTEDRPFPLATDPHKCAFGKWYYSYEPTSQSVAFHLGKLEEPHAKLHQTALEAFSCARECATCARGECLRDTLKRGTEVYMPQVLSLLEEAKQVFRDSYRKMVVVVSDGTRRCGVLVDEVMTVEQVHLVKPLNERGADGRPPLVTAVVQRAADEELILLLDAHQILAWQQTECEETPTPA